MLQVLGSAEPGTCFLRTMIVLVKKDRAELLCRMSRRLHNDLLGQIHTVKLAREVND